MEGICVENSRRRICQPSNMAKTIWNRSGNIRNRDEEHTIRWNAFGSRPSIRFPAQWNPTVFVYIRHDRVFQLVCMVYPHLHLCHTQSGQISGLRCSGFSIYLCFFREYFRSNDPSVHYRVGGTHGTEECKTNIWLKSSIILSAKKQEGEYVWKLSSKRKPADQANRCPFSLLSQEEAAFLLAWKNF